MSVRVVVDDISDDWYLPPVGQEHRYLRSQDTKEAFSSINIHLK